MPIAPFIFSSANLPRLKAKQLRKAFPFLKLAAAQEATARALGHASWYECTHRGSQGQISLPDEAVDLPTRVARRFHQSCVLMDLGIAPGDADNWIRAWGITGRPTLSQEVGIPLYTQWNNALGKLERGEVTAEQLVEEWGEDWSKYPEIDRPRRVCPGVILGPCGKYPHYAVDPTIHCRIPSHLRGPTSLYHYEDGAHVLATMIHGFPQDASSGESLFDRANRVQHEWRHGEKHPESKERLLPLIEEAALAVPDDMVVISERAMPIGNGEVTFDRLAVACLRGRDFAAFIRNKGVFDPSAVVWYRDVPLDFSRGSMEWRSWLDTGGWNVGPEKPELPLFKGTERFQPASPVYSYPFMSAPMASDEYGSGFERVCLMPLDEDHVEDDDDGGDGDDGDNDGLGPEGPSVHQEETLETHESFSDVFAELRGA